MKKIYILDKKKIDSIRQKRKLGVRYSIQHYLLWRWCVGDYPNSLENKLEQLRRIQDIKDARYYLQSFYNIFGKEG